LDSQFFKQVPLDKDSSSHTLNSADMLEVLGSQNLMISMEYGSSQSSSTNMKSEGKKALRYDLCSLLCSRCRSNSKSATIKPTEGDTSIFSFLQQLTSYSSINNLALFKCLTCLRRAQKNKQVALVAMCSRCAFDHHATRSKHKLEVAYKMTKKEVR
jgi:hypothetical protein